MTQKELLYVEDAVCHEESIISYLNYAIDNIDDDSLISFLEKEIDRHNLLLKKQIKYLKEKSNE